MPVGEPNPVAHDLAHGVVACGPAEDEHDGREHVELTQFLDHLGPQRWAVRQARPAAAGLPVGTAAPLQRSAHRLVDAQPLTAGTAVVEQQREQQVLAVLAPVHGEVVAQDDRPFPFHDHGRVAPHRAQPPTQLARVVDRRREAHEADLGRRHDQDLLPHPAPVGVLNEVDLVEDHGVQSLQEVGAGQKHVAQHLGGHHDDGRPRPHRRVSRQQPHVVLAVRGHQLAVLLVRQGLERRRVERLASGRQRTVHRVRRHERLSRTGGRRDEHRMPRVEGGERLALEVVERERQVGLELRRPGRLLDGPRERRQRPSSFPMPMERK